MVSISGFNFKPRESGKTIAALLCKDTDSCYRKWIIYYPDTGCCLIAGNTDKLSLWLYRTRPDLTPDLIIQFVKELNAVLETGPEPILVRELIDPKDWQGIAGIPDAYADDRYRLNMI